MRGKFFSHRKHLVIGIGLLPSALMILYMNFYALNTAVLHLNNVTVILPSIFLVACFCVVLSNKKLQFGKKQLLPLTRIYWLLFLSLQSFMLYSFSLDGRMMLRQLMYYLIWCVIALCSGWADSVIKWIIKIGYVNVLATLFFFVFPSTYSVMIGIYGAIPSGTSGGTAGCRAGLADHYSQNGIFLSIVIIALACNVLAMPRKKKRKKEIVLLLMAFIAILLSSKRGALIFTLISILLTYCLTDTKRLLNKGFRIMLVSIGALAAFFLLSQYIPALSYVIERFQVSGEDTSSQERFMMWELALNMFKRHPFLGNGTYSFRHSYARYIGGLFHSDTRYTYLNSHNVFLQILCENGIIGLVLFIIAAGNSFLKTIKLNRVLNNDEGASLTNRINAMVALAIQTYTLFYCLTGNCLYDIVFAFYSFALVMGEYLWYRQSRKIKVRGKVL